ncbi:nectin-3-like protein isoform X1 [Myxocyprinus asiaticus]|uniref:nectin-3-like protein isoform X1 n=1 Tax=Myxocyprinus asiaticus TaxID=70543 RepID=UPI002221BD22|nr:nectin-3-like protein isoform X1 [Myxocyprinus asiaticus]
MTISFACYFLISKGELATGRPANVSVTSDETPVVGYSEFTLATCTASRSQPAAQVSWHLDTLTDSVKVLTNTVKHLDGTYTVTSSLIGSPTVEMNQQHVQCVVRHSTLKEDLEIDHTIVVHYPPQLVTVTPLENFFSAHGYQCEADANPAATHFSWHSRMNQAMPDESINVEGNRLYFLKLTPDLSGLYICNASNEYGAGFGSLYWHKGEKMEDNHSEL